MSTPRVTIGVPVYNGQKYIRFALDSLLAQTIPDLEVVVTDNCSTDSTPRIVRDYAARDPRVKYVRNNTNLGPARNYNRCIELARGGYFKWSSADDVCAADFIEKCVKVLDADPSVVLVYPRTSVIDPEGKVVYHYGYELELADPRPYVRLARLLNVNHKVHGAHELYGVMRTEALRSTPGMRMHVRGDSALLARLALLGRLQRVEEYLFFNRDHTDRSSRYLPEKMVRGGSRLARYLGSGPLPASEWWDGSLRGKIVFPEWRVLGEYIRAVRETGRLTPAEKLAGYGALGTFTLRHLPKMGRDVVIAAEQYVNLLVDKRGYRAL